MILNASVLFLEVVKAIRSYDYFNTLLIKWLSAEGLDQMQSLDTSPWVAVQMGVGITILTL